MKRRSIFKLLAGAVFMAAAEVFGMKEVPAIPVIKANTLFTSTGRQWFGTSKKPA